jgi:hypothetical protein
MHQRSSLRLAGAALALAAVMAACGGAGSGRPADRAAGEAGAITSPESSPAGDASLNPDSGAPTFEAAAATPRPTATQTISTTEASDLLRQVDDLLRQADGDLAADGDAAITMGE